MEENVCGKKLPGGERGDGGGGAGGGGGGDECRECWIMASCEGAGKRGVGRGDIVGEAFGVNPDEGEERGHRSLGKSDSLSPNQDIVFFLSEVFVWFGHTYDNANDCLNDLLYDHIPYHFPPRYSISLRQFCWCV